MKRFQLLAVAGCAAALAVVLLQSCGVLGGPPGNVQVGAATDSTVIVAWTPPVEGGPDSYLVSFRALGDSNFTRFAETTATTVTHDPQGMTGEYKVAAKFGADAYEATEVATTVPVYCSTKTLAEVDGPGNAGYGWDREDGTCRTYTMRETGSAEYVDFYVTDFHTGSYTTPYCIASPHMGPAEQSGVVPAAAWLRSGITDSLPRSSAPLPAIDSAHYFIYSAVSRAPARFGVYTVADEHYAMVQVTRVDAASAVMDVESWFQLVPGLRLIAHEW
jgi:hypothetical protein